MLRILLTAYGATALLTGYASEPVTVGGHTAVGRDRMRVPAAGFFQTRSLMEEVEFVDVTYLGAEGQALMMPWVEEER